MILTQENISEKLDIAIQEGRVVPYYQPKYDSITNYLSGSEALARWIDEDGKIISPDNFIPSLEKSCLITKLDWHILEQVCIFLRKQIDSKNNPVTISVNFSRAHTYEEDFIEMFSSIVDKYNIPHEYIEIEITESTLAKSSANIIQFIQQIRDKGFEVAIDDFGSGLSSLNFVKDVPASVLKIDKSLFSENCENEKERIVLESIFGFAKRLHLTTVAEGVETKEQLSFLRTCGCEQIQGYYFSKPLKQDEYVEICKQSENKPETEDILKIQPHATASELLIDAMFMCYPLIIMINLTRDSYYMMTYDNFTTHTCVSTGIASELVENGALTMHPDDQEIFKTTFNVEDQIKKYQAGEKSVHVITRQLGDDGIYRRVETTNFLVKNPSSDDFIVVTLAKPIYED